MVLFCEYVVQLFRYIKKELKYWYDYVQIYIHINKCIKPTVFLTDGIQTHALTIHAHRGSYDNRTSSGHLSISYFLSTFFFELTDGNWSQQISEKGKPNQIF
jgi:hypothetical protein